MAEGHGAARHRPLFASAVGGRIDINNWRSREWTPALRAAGVEHRRIYDMRHTFATWSLAAGMSVFTLSRRMGTSVQMIDQTYGHLARDADDYDRGLPDAYDEAEAARGHVVGTILPDATWAILVRREECCVLRLFGVMGGARLERATSCL